MTAKLKLSAALDMIGIGALTAAAAALGGRAWFQGVAESSVFSSFFTFLGVALIAFLVARTVQIAHVVRHTPGPRTRRVAQAQGQTARMSSVPANVVEEPESSDLPRAA